MIGVKDGVRRRLFRWTAAFTVMMFAASVVLPLPLSAAATASEAAANVENASRKALADLWFYWVDHIKELGRKLKAEEAFAFFRKHGATESQAAQLTRNAAAEGQLAGTAVGTEAASERGNIITQWWKRLTSRRRGTPKADELPVSSSEAAASASKKGFFARFLEKFRARRKARTVSNDLLSARLRGDRVTVKSNREDLALVTHRRNAGKVVVEAEPVTPKPGFFGRMKEAFKDMFQGVHRTFHAAGGALKTGALTIGDKLDFHKYYELPVTENTTIKVRGEFKGVTKFTKKGWVVSQRTSTSHAYGQMADYVAGRQLEATASKPCPGGVFARSFQRFKDSLAKLKARLGGRARYSPETKAELTRLKLEGDLMEHARILNEAQRAIKIRIDNLRSMASHLGKEPPVDEIRALEARYRSIEKMKHDVARKMDELHSSPAGSVMKDAAKWALYSVGITASINLIRQAVKGEKLDFHKALSFMGEPQFWGGTAGGFLGSMMFRTLFAGIMPAGIFFQVLPSFLGAALGFEYGAAVFGAKADLLGTVVQSVASAGGYALAASLLGPGAPALVLMAAAIGAGSLAAVILDKLRGGPEAEAFVLPKNVDASAPPKENLQGAPAAVPAVKPPHAPARGMDLAKAQEQMRKAYNDYINYLKQRKVAEARAARKRYEEAKKVLDGLRSQLAAPAAHASN